MKATAIAPANIAFIKYWGKADDVLRLPLNSSLSMNLSGAQTVTTVEFSPDYKHDRIDMTGETMSDKERERVSSHLDRIRMKAGTKLSARVVTKNNFVKGTGIASSASGFAALTVAGCAALGLNLSEKELTILARLGSGSACRSIPDGFVEWVKGYSSDSSFAYSLYPASYWDLRDILVVVQKGQKKVSSTEGMEGLRTSPLWQARIAGMENKIARVKDALEKKDIRLLGETIEEETLNMHTVARSQNPPLLYWTPKTEEIMTVVRKWRSKGLVVYCTIDAGPNVHLICEARDEQEVTKKAKSLTDVWSVGVNKPARGAHVVGDDLF